jgi:putative transposase
MLYYVHKQEAKDWHTKQLIESTLERHPAYGHKRLALYLKINKKRILRVMHKYGITPYRKRRSPWKKPRSSYQEYPNLLKTMELQQGMWATDFTYLWFGNRFIYVATILDIYTKEIMGVAVSTRHDTNLVLQALTSALMYHPKPLLIHSDHGSEYTSKLFVEYCTLAGIRVSMSKKGCPWENGYQESFYDKFKIDLGDAGRFSTLGELVYAIYQTVWYYNHDRIHTTIKMTPKEFAEKIQKSYALDVSLIV